MVLEDKFRQFREKTLEDLKELQAVNCFLNLHDSAALNMLQTLHEEILKAASQAQLETFSHNLRIQVEKIRKHFNVIAPREVMLSYLEQAIGATPPGDVFFLRKHSLSQLTPIYDSF